MWERIFINNDHWEGAYEFHKRKYKFTFESLSVQPDFSGSVLGLFIDSNAKFDLEGELKLKKCNKHGFTWFHKHSV